MSKETTTVRYVCETAIGLRKSVGYTQVNSVISQARSKIFDFNYPIFDENYRSVLETKILKHFYTRQICETPVALWKLWLDDKMNMIMPYYNQLYKSQLLSFDPLLDVDYKRTGNKKDTGNSNSTNNQNAKVDTERNDSSHTETDMSTTDTDTNMDVYQDTPQSSLSGVETLEYITNARKMSKEGGTDSTGSSTTRSDGSDATISSTDGTNVNQFSNLNDYSEAVFGKMGSVTYSKMLQEFRETFLNIDKMVIEELNELFFGLYDGGSIYDR